MQSDHKYKYFEYSKYSSENRLLLYSNGGMIPGYDEIGTPNPRCMESWTVHMILRVDLGVGGTWIVQG